MPRPTSPRSFRSMLLALLAVPCLPLPAHALPPSAMPGQFQVGSGAIDRLQVSEDGSVLVGLDAGSGGWLLFVEDWSTHTLSLCAGSQLRGLTTVAYDDQTWEVWGACSDGTMQAQHFDGSRLSAVEGDDGQPVSVSVASSLEGVWYDAVDFTLYGLADDGDTPAVHVVDLETLATDASVFQGYPLALGWTGFEEAVLHGDALFVHHGGSNMSSVWLGTPPSATPSLPMGLGLSVQDIAPSPAGGVFAVGSGGQLAEYLPINNQFQIRLTGLSGLEGVAASVDPDDRWIATTGEQVKVWELDDNGLIVGGAEGYLWAGPVRSDTQTGDAVVLDGYLFGAGTGGRLHVATARPWVYPDSISVSPQAATAGDQVTLSFSVNQPGSWEIRRGGDRTGSGTLLASGTAVGDEEVSVELTVDQGWMEGDNPLYAIHRGGFTAQTGHARTTLFVDNPPDPPKLGPGSLGFRDQGLILSFAGIEDADLDRYEVYVSTEPFDAASYPTGGPDYDGTTALTTPITVRAAPGESVSVRIEPLENYVKHYVAVRAWDEGGLEGPMSRVVSETPRPSFTAAELAGETGGTPCSTSPRAVGWMALGVAALGLARRRRSAAALALIGAGLLSAGSAEAADKKAETGDLTPVYGNFEVRYGVVNLEDETIKQVFDRNPHNMLQLEFGPQILQVFELDVGMGFFQELATTVDEGGLASSDKTMLTMWPFSIDGTFRLQILDEQLFVPHVRYGFDYVLYSELTDDGAGGKTSVRGAKVGNHWGVGGGLLLDFFAPRRASLLEAQTGINDTYLVVEWRRQSVDHRNLPWGAPVKQGFDFSGTMFTVGLKLDY